MDVNATLLHRRRETRGTKYQIDDTRAWEGKRRERERGRPSLFSRRRRFPLTRLSWEEGKGRERSPSSSSSPLGCCSRSRINYLEKRSERENGGGGKGKRTNTTHYFPPKKRRGGKRSLDLFFLEIAKLPLLTREGFLYSSLNDLFPFRAWERRGQQQRKEGEKSPFSARMPLPFPLPPPPPPISHPFG